MTEKFSDARFLNVVAVFEKIRTAGMKRIILTCGRQEIICQITSLPDLTIEKLRTGLELRQALFATPKTRKFSRRF